MTTAGDDPALRRMLRERDAEAIVANFEGFARWIIQDRGYYLPGGSIDDLMQEARIGILKAVRDYRGDAGSSFRTFADLCIRQQVITAVKTATRRKHTPLNEAVGIDHPAPGRQDDNVTLAEVIPLHGQDPVERLIAREEAETTLATIAHDLSLLERDAIVGFSFDDLSYREVALRLGVPDKTVDNAIQRARRKIAAGA